ncbi:SDR family NAD(P)-dependent oxidoreductase [Lachnospiraceae bacterium LCP25S3_G4]
MKRCKIAVVTGASSGMGREFVKQIEDLYVGLNEIWVLARRGERLEALEHELKTPLRIFSLDLGEKNSFCKVQEVLEEVKPDIRMLVNAAGFGKIGKVEELDIKDQTEMIDINCRALTNMTYICLPYMSNGSRIVNLASAASFVPQPNFVVYAASKSYALSFSRGLNEEVEPKNIFVTAVCPGPVDTEFFDVAGGKDGVNVMKRMVMANPQKVVRQALLDSVAGKAVSVYGIPMKSANFATKVLPHGLVLKVMKHF